MLPLQGILIQVDTSNQEEELKKEEKAKKALRGAVSGRKEIFLHDLCLYSNESSTKAQMTWVPALGIRKGDRHGKVKKGARRIN